ncbi:MAG: hypothetical protein ABSG99_08175 [Sedimentisphaerales bacterium]
MNEKTIVTAVVNALTCKGFRYVTTEVANFYRSVDVGAIDNKGNIWAIECKVSNIGRAIEQSKTHKLSADKVFIATFRKNIRENTLNRIRDAGVGLLYVTADGLMSEPIEEPKENRPWSLARDRFLARIMEGD